MIKKFMLFIGITALFSACLFSFLFYLFWNPSDVRPDTITFYLKIPEVIKKVELFNPITSPLYGVSSSDGEKVGSTDVYYESKAPLSDLVVELTENGAKCEEFENRIFVCDFAWADGYMRQTTLTTKESSVGIQETIIGDM